MQVHTASRPATRHQPGRQAPLHYYYLARQAVSVCVASQQYILYSHNIEKLPWQPARQDWLDLGPGWLAWRTNGGKLSARFSLDLLPGFEILAGKCVLCNTDATARTATESVIYKGMKEKLPTLCPVVMAAVWAMSPEEVLRLPGIINSWREHFPLWGETGWVSKFSFCLRRTFVWYLMYWGERYQREREPDIWCIIKIFSHLLFTYLASNLIKSGSRVNKPKL